MSAENQTREAKIMAKVPWPVTQICRDLQAAGFEAVTVGGAVRDVLLGREPGDWDVATSATPEQVMKLFVKTVPTGLAHGTVTVMIPGGHEHRAIEVTTFRKEFGYEDGRHPDRVEFGVPLIEDLARRDFVVNAIAFDPIRKIIFDPFDGINDLSLRVIRAVGDSVLRLSEDGLRIVRAARFASQLEFSLDPATKDAMNKCLSSLAKVSVERIWTELCKLLVGPGVATGLTIARETGILSQILPPSPDDANWDQRMRLLSALPKDLIVRLVGLFLHTNPAYVEKALVRLKASNADRQYVLGLLSLLASLRDCSEVVKVRHAVSKLPREKLVKLETFVDVVVTMPLGDPWQDSAPALRKILADNDPLSVAELALSGGEIMSALGIGPGPAVGKLQKQVLERVLFDPSLNSKEALLSLIHDLIRSG